VSQYAIFGSPAGRAGEGEVVGAIGLDMAFVMAISSAQRREITVS
jgi:hypothetical protein